MVKARRRAFDHPNLYLCDGNLMPDLSERGPTLTVVALANRRAAHLRKEL